MFMPSRTVIALLVAVCLGASQDVRAQDSAAGETAARETAARETAVDAEIADLAACGQRQASAIGRSGSPRGFAAVEASLATACKAELAALRQGLLAHDMTPQAATRAIRAVQARLRPQWRGAFEAAAVETRRARDAAGVDPPAEGNAPPAATAPPVAASVPLPPPRPRDLEVRPGATGSLQADAPSAAAPSPMFDGPSAPDEARNAPTQSPAVAPAARSTAGQAGAAVLPAERSSGPVAGFVPPPPARHESPTPARPSGVPSPPDATKQGPADPQGAIGEGAVEAAPAIPAPGSVATVEAAPPLPVETPPPVRVEAAPPFAVEAAPPVPVEAAPPVPVEAAPPVTETQRPPDPTNKADEGTTRVARSPPEADRSRLLDSAIGLHRVCLARAVIGLRPGGTQAEAVAQVMEACRTQQEARIAREIDVDGSPDPIVRQRIERAVADVTRTEVSDLMTLLRGSQR